MEINDNNTQNYTAIIECGNFKIGAIECSLIISKNYNADNEIHLLFNEKIPDQISYNNSPFKIIGHRYNIIGTLIETFIIENAHQKSVSETILPNHEVKRELVLLPEDVYIISGNLTCSPSNALVMFNINKAPVLSPNISTDTDINGNIIRKRTWQPKINIDQDNTIHGDLFYNIKEDKYETVMQPYQVLTLDFNVDSEAQIPEKINIDYLLKIDDMLTLASFAQAGKIRCSGWTVFSINNCFRYYRNNTFKVDDIRDFRVGIIKKDEIETFLNRSLVIYQSSRFKESITRAINAVITNNDTIVELSFLTMFQALESLVITYKRLDGTEYIIDITRWDELKTKIKFSLKECLLNELTPKEIKKMQGKISELNRPSLKNSFESMEKSLNLQIEEFWPIFDTEDIIGLASIRNMLAHGESFPTNVLPGILLAHACLQSCLARIILNLLQWPVEETELSKNSFHSSFYTDGTAIRMQKELTEFIRTPKTPS
ncbi:hypothetical protein ACL2XO_04870 [Sodalis sp. RH15]|uniref:hypothetical protein n=1 Tax=Sodalis sp. RH15 TaxID=3394330 RepID=UPI0039B6313E